MPLKEVTDTIQTISYSKPKTILGFFAIVLAILGTTCSIIIGVMSHSKELHIFIPWILGFLAIIFVATLVGVFITAWKDPTILMLGQVTGQDYITNRRLTLGDSEQGEYIEISSTTSPTIIANQTLAALPEPKSDEGDNNAE